VPRPVAPGRDDQEIGFAMSIFNGMALTFVGAAIALSVSPAANAQVCSRKSLKGSFGYTVTGSIVADLPASPASPVLIKGPFAAVGRITFDGQDHA
jgi:hypothetical protein